MDSWKRNPICKNNKYYNTNASKQVESKTPLIGIFYSNIVKSSLIVKSVDASTQTLPVTAWATTSQKFSCSVDISYKIWNMPELKLLPPSSEPIVIEFCPPPETNSQISTHSSQNSSNILCKHPKYLYFILQLLIFLLSKISRDLTGNSAKRSHLYLSISVK